MSSENNSLSNLIEQTPISLVNNQITVVEDVDTLTLSGQQKARVERIRQNTLSRTKLTTWTSLAVSFWLISVVVLLFCNKGRFTFNLLNYKIDIIPNVSDSVLEVLLVTTTLNVLGLSFIVLKGLFNVSYLEQKKIP